MRKMQSFASIFEGYMYCLRFDFGWPLCAFTKYIYLLTYLLTYLLSDFTTKSIHTFTNQRGILTDFAEFRKYFQGMIWEWMTRENVRHLAAGKYPSQVEWFTWLTVYTALIQYNIALIVRPFSCHYLNRCQNSCHLYTTQLNACYHYYTVSQKSGHINSTTEKILF